MDPAQPIVEATNGNNAADKNWKLLYWANDAPIATTGSYDCLNDVSDKVLDMVSAKIYPIPAVKTLTIESEEQIELLQLFDATGRMVISKTRLSGKTSLDVTHLKNGLYILKLCTRQGTKEYKVMKNEWIAS